MRRVRPGSHAWSQTFSFFVANFWLVETHGSYLDLADGSAHDRVGILVVDIAVLVLARGSFTLDLDSVKALVVGACLRVSWEELLLLKFFLVL